MAQACLTQLKLCGFAAIEEERLPFIQDRRSRRTAFRCGQRCSSAEQNDLHRNGHRLTSSANIRYRALYERVAPSARTAPHYPNIPSARVWCGRYRLHLQLKDGCGARKAQPLDRALPPSPQLSPEGRGRTIWALDRAPVPQREKEPRLGA